MLQEKLCKCDNSLTAELSVDVQLQAHTYIGWWWLGRNSASEGNADCSKHGFTFWMLCQVVEHKGHQCE